MRAVQVLATLWSQHTSRASVREPNRIGRESKKRKKGGRGAAG